MLTNRYIRALNFDLKNRPSVVEHLIALSNQHCPFLVTIVFDVHILQKQKSIHLEDKHEEACS